MRPRGRRREVALAALIAVLLLPAPAAAQGDPDAATVPAMVFDAVILRPVGLVATATGLGLFAVAAVMTAPGGRDSIQEAWNHFVATPGKSVFRRPLGDF